MFFIGLVAFISIFIGIFGSDNSMVAVMILVALLMMLEQDLSQKPITSLIGMIILNVSIGIVCFISQINPWLGIPLVFCLFFALIFLMMHDLKSPMYFPFALGYMLIMSTPVPASGMPMRILSLIVGSFLIIGINILINRGKLRKNYKEGLTGLIKETKSTIEKKLAGEELSEKILIENNKLISSAIYDRLKSNYYSTP